MRASTIRKLCTLSTLYRSHSAWKAMALASSSSVSISEHNASEFNHSSMSHNRVPSRGAEDSPDDDNTASEVSSIVYSPSLAEEPVVVKEEPVVEEVDYRKAKMEKVADLTWCPNLSPGYLLTKRRGLARERKSKWIFKLSHDVRFDRLVKMCAKRLGTGTTLDVFRQLGRETGVKEFNALIKMSIQKARTTDNEYIAIEELSKAFHLLENMKECGFKLEEETYQPLLRYVIDMGMVKEFQLFSDVVRAECSVSRLGYYEMLLWIRVEDEEMIRDICEYITVEDGQDTAAMRENYLLALCESDLKFQITDVLKNIDITMFSSAKSIASVFQSLGRLQLESLAENLFLDLRAQDFDEDDISGFIADFAVSTPNLAVEDIISKFKSLHDLLEVLHSSSSYEKLIMYCCDIGKVDVALDLVDNMCEAGFTLSTRMLQSILHICEETYEHILVGQINCNSSAFFLPSQFVHTVSIAVVYRIYSIIQRFHLKLNGEICRCLVNFCVRVKDFKGAYKMVDDLEKMNFKPTTAMYNAIMAGYFREKNISGALRVLKHMQDANVNPDVQTFSYLISNCETEEDIIKYREEMEQYKIPLAKPIFMALINSYAACGKLDMAKQVILDPNIPAKSLNEIKSVLVSALASHGQLSEALLVYEEINKAGYNLEPKAVISLIEEFTKFKGELDGMLMLLTELSDLDYWVDGCFRVIIYCVHNKHLSSAIDLFKKLKDKFESDELVLEVLFDEVFAAIATSESSNLQIGLDLLWAVKNELGLVPSRQCLDFLLSACTNAGDLSNARLIWREYEVAGFPYNVLSYLRMYQALLASGDYRSANFMLSKIPKDDSEVSAIIKACQETYSGLSSVAKKKTKVTKKKEKREA
ncbi:pentatricopeptide repeat-containing protein At4g04790, mitochondrial isoform X1 [Arachis ipaensis]|uniref:pentatricopeptide repeat-containing protein At4g04790, mitochondrial isoform X1 n=1 Tax=Arachis ipaensis TaxID=130454 RepID=UPI000A2B8767|nr:pentatricopeptide repeat-containing protein At4g04790, mitochondrial isoform X1 [Arachis ipaensis]XP_025643714.1 pentatricopeptide repeat-containing protein At4g04790, mitochondrial isoform X1 [Arachis hypogaea]